LQRKCSGYPCSNRPNIDDVLWKEAGCATELDYTEQTSWLLFLKYLDNLEQDKSTEAALEGRKYTRILDGPHRWGTWAAPKGKDGKLDHNKAMTGEDLRDFVNGKLFPHLHGITAKASGPNTLEYKIGQIFGEIKNKIQSGYNLREIIDHIDELRFRSQAEKHELSHLYEAKIRNMGNAGRNGGEYYTPRPRRPGAARAGPQGKRTKRHAHRGDHRFAVGQNGAKRGRRGYDAGKKIKGRKRHIAVDTQGNLLAVIVHSAGIQDRVAARAVLMRLFCRFDSITTSSPTAATQAS
jgi:hypothetical protein